MQVERLVHVPVDHIAEDPQRPIDLDCSCRSSQDST
jgi:hypothetical protein